MSADNQSNDDRIGLDNVLADYLDRVDRGESVDQESLVRAHPDLADELREFFAHEKVVRSPLMAETENFQGQLTPQNVLQVRCPHCHTPTAVAVDTALVDMTCPGCGSVYSITGDSSQTRSATTMSQVGHFELIERIGVGGFGSVWKARDTELDRAVAVKIPRRGEMSAEETEKFLREARAAAQLKHPNIVAVHEVGRDGETIYIVCDLVRGITLDDWLTGQQPTSREAAELCIKIAEALHHAHEKGVIHRDLKPGNIMIDGEGEPHLMDFGLARREVGEVTVTIEGQVLGTPAYMSPEQAEGESHRADRRSDIYSIGVILFKLLTGELPFRGNARMLMHQVIHEEPPSPRRLNSNVSRDMETITLKCLEKEPDKRYQTAKEFEEELQRFLRGEAIETRPIHRLEKAWRWCKRKPAIASLAATIVILGIVAPVVAFRQASLRAKAEKLNDELQNQLAINLLERAASEYGAGIFGRGIALSVAAYQRATTEDLRVSAKNLMAAGNERQPKLLFHEGPVRSAAFSPDGRQILTGSSDRTARLWDASSGKELQRFEGHENWVNSVAFSPDGRQILTGSSDRTARLWDASSGKELQRFEGHENWVNSVAFSPDGRQILTGSSDGNARLWDTASGKELQRFKGHEGYVYSVAFSSDGRQILTGSSDRNARVILWDTASGKELQRFKGHEGYVYSVAFSPDGRQILTGSSDQIARLWDTFSGKELQQFHGHIGTVHSVAFSPHGRQILTGGKYDQTVRLWDTASGKELQRFEGHENWVNSVAFSPDGRQILTGSDDQSARLWGTSSGKELQRFEGQGYVNVAFSPDGRQILTGSSDQTARLWDTASGKELQRFEVPGHTAYSIAFSPDGRQILTGSNDQTARLWDTASGKELQRFEGHDSWVDSVAFSPDGQQILTGCHGQTARLWDTSSGKELQRFEGHEYWVSSVAFSPDGRQIVTGSNGQTARLWDASSGKELQRFEGHGGTAHSVAFSPDGRQILTGSSDQTAKLWDASSGKKLQQFQGHDAWVSSVAFSPDGRQILTGSYDGIARLWDTSSGKELQRFEVPGHAAYSIAFSPDGRQVLTGSADGTARLWDVSQSVPKEPDLIADLGVVRSGMKLNNDGLLVLVTAAEWSTSLDSLLDAGVEWGKSATDGQKRLWHLDHYSDAIESEQGFAAVFHLERLIRIDPKEAVAAAQHVIAANPGNKSVTVHLAHAQLFDGQFEQAKALYAEIKEGGEQGEKTVLEDFEEMRRRGVMHPDMEKIVALMKSDEETHASMLLPPKEDALPPVPSVPTPPTSR